MPSLEVEVAEGASVWALVGMLGSLGSVGTQGATSGLAAARAVPSWRMHFAQHPGNLRMLARSA